MYPPQITDPDKFHTLAFEANQKINNHPHLTDDTKKRWQKAIAKAVFKINEQGEFLTYIPADDQLVVWSQGSDRIYAAAGNCQCLAFQSGQPCWHRAAARLFKSYFGITEVSVSLSASQNQAKDGVGGGIYTPSLASEMDNAIYCKPEIKTEKIGGFRI